MATAIFRMYDRNGSCLLGIAPLEREYETRDDLNSLKEELQPRGWELECCMKDGEFV